METSNLMDYKRSDKQPGVETLEALTTIRVFALLRFSPTQIPNTTMYMQVLYMHLLKVHTFRGVRLQSTNRLVWMLV